MTFNIAICDDEKIICDSLFEKLKEISEKKNIKFVIDCFFSGEELCDEMKFVNYDLLFLDIELPEMNGVAVGRYIRDTMKNESIHIAYISSKQEYAMELFEMRPINFLVKPLSDNKIRKIVDTFLVLNKVDTELFKFKIGQSYYKISLSDIFYFCSNGRKVKIISQDMEYEFYGSLENIYEEIKSKNFLFVHKSFIINYKYISKYEYDNILMVNNDVIPISQSRRKATRTMFLKIKEDELI